MKAAWVNLILKITSFIQKSKAKLPTTHALHSIVLVFLIIVAEIILAIVSFPLYLVEQRLGKSDAGIKEYKTRRAITLSVVAAIAVIWLIKLAMIVAATVFFSQTPETTIQTSTQTETEINQEQIFSAQQASLNTSLTPPTITQVNYNRQKGIEVLGTTDADQQVFVYLQRLAEENLPQDTNSITVMTTQAKSDGTFSVIPDLQQFHFTEGRYQVTATTLDKTTQTFSKPSQGIIFAVPTDIGTSNNYIQRLDTVLNVSIFILVAFGILLTFLVT